MIVYMCAMYFIHVQLGGRMPYYNTVEPLNAKPVIIALRTKRKKHGLLRSKSSLGVLI